MGIVSINIASGFLNPVTVTVAIGGGAIAGVFYIGGEPLRNRISDIVGFGRGG